MGGRRGFQHFAFSFVKSNCGRYVLFIGKFPAHSLKKAEFLFLLSLRFFFFFIPIGVPICKSNDSEFP